ncbi:TlpA family protein disulfide reductase [Sulfurimonas lithotrophica]|uniref:TlpA family protein disulfide reductase n=1 Tax=Sulfurimonas lithotrophica TaxID=2590022 RepID=A0A5P8P1M3_9BACT|nr:TlpA disulfide reductase family protein [Sulfurimonas lithotrophica]QFR49530.1 TlpA family protein disulfide reductase [Sulfurimonas lithotrophica]
MLNKSLVYITLILSLTFFTACSSDNEANDMLASNEFVLTTTDAKQIVVKKNDKDGFSIDGQNGKVIVFDIFATWCPPCQASASHLTSLQEKYKDKILVIGSTVERPEFTKEGNIVNDKLEEFRLKHNAKYTIVNSDQNLRLNNAITSSLKMGERYPIPTVVLYKDGKYINHYVGSIQEEFIESDIKRALEI